MNLNKKDQIYSYPYAIKANFPLQLDKINLRNNSKFITLNDEITIKIKETIRKYAEEIDHTNTMHSNNDIYLNTIQLRDSQFTIYLVLFKHFPNKVINSKALFYNNLAKEFADNDFDFNLHALYDYKVDHLEKSNLKKLFKIITPEIEILDFNKDGVNDYKFVRLVHNGSYNAILTTILTVQNSSLVTLYSCERCLGELCGPSDCLY